MLQRDSKLSRVRACRSEDWRLSEQTKFPSGGYKCCPYNFAMRNDAHAKAYLASRIDIEAGRVTWPETSKDLYARGINVYARVNSVSRLVDVADRHSVSCDTPTSHANRLLFSCWISNLRVCLTRKKSQAILLKLNQSVVIREELMILEFYGSLLYVGGIYSEEFWIHYDIREEKASRSSCNIIPFNIVSNYSKIWDHHIVFTKSKIFIMTENIFDFIKYFDFIICQHYS